MAGLIFGYLRGPVPSSEMEVRSTVTAVDNDAPSAVADHAPDFNEHLTDPDTEGGLTPHQLGSYVVPSEQYAPWHSGAANAEHNEIVNRQVSTSGTAAAREAAGEWGHGTMHVQEGIEPTIRDLPQMGNSYFAADQPDIQQPMGDYMTPSRAADPEFLASVQSTGNANSRQAASPYAAYLREMMG